MKTSELVKIIGSVSTVLVLLFGISFATVLKRFRIIFQYPDHHVTFTVQDSVLHHEVHDLQHAQEFTWELLRLMTDNHDSTVLKVVIDDQGVAHDVDIRETAEGIQLAFVFDYFVVFPIRYNPADSRMFINVHDYNTGETKKYYLR